MTIRVDTLAYSADKEMIINLASEFFGEFISDFKGYVSFKFEYIEGEFAEIKHEQDGNIKCLIKKRKESAEKLSDDFLKILSIYSK